MRVACATVPGDPAVPNEDWVTATPNIIVVLDGATARIETGCVHGVAWYVNKLGAALVDGAFEQSQPLPDVLVEGIRRVATQHPQCDLTHPGTPSAGVAMLRLRADVLEYLVLADTTVVIEAGHEPHVVTDNRVAAVAAQERAEARRLPFGSPARDKALREAKRTEQKARNRPGGFWVAAADPTAAEHTIAGAVPMAQVDRFAVLTDGAARCVDTFDLLTWTDLLDVLDKAGPAELIRQVRAAEAVDPDGRRWPRNKNSDDATVVYGQR
ncbi:hypothetical protein FDG2_1876 [Candidatus Protofrankia californiensis]|uniref:PPM-type phosphatase domain-containing protein n=1 Tax=Candidatus Protofrankia californiensis TaxID=1839754 RepID=A0A1C3NWG0_9ACTN|nr:hypothetical protein FDG2_1876 [Candidatus Protofrankia californiensis]